MDASGDYGFFAKQVFSQLTPADFDCVTRVLELICVRDGHLTLSGFSPNEIDVMISSLLTE